jgi:hypothetical protein
MPTQNPGTNPNMNNRGPKGPNQNTFDSIAMLDEKFKALRLSVQNQIKFAQNTFKKEIINNPKARDNFIEDIKWQISVLGNFYEDLPTDSDIDSNIVDKNERKKEKSILLKLREKVSKLINDLEKKYCISFDDEMKDMENNSPEKIDERNVGKLNKINSELGSCYSSFFSLYKDLKERKKMQTKLSEEEKMSFGEKLRDVKSAYDISSAELEEMLEDKGVNSLNFSDKVQLILVGKAQNLISEMTTGPSSLLIKIETSLNEKVDDTEKKLDSLYSDTDIITQNASKLLSEVSLECEKMPKGVKLENFDKKRFEELSLQRSKLEGEIIIFRSEHEKFLDDCVSDGGTPDTKRLIKLEVLETKMENIFFLMDMISEKITRNDYMSSKEQRENAKGLSERVGVIENEINTDYDKMGVGDGFSDDKKETYSLMLDVEIINLKHAESNLGGLPDIPENKPTRSLVERVVNRVR